jgi:hypothetical protein
VAAWDQATALTIDNCWRKCGLLRESLASLDDNPHTAIDELERTEKEGLGQMISAIDFGPDCQKMSAADFVEIRRSGGWLLS